MNTPLYHYILKQLNVSSLGEARQLLASKLDNRNPSKSFRIADRLLSSNTVSSGLVRRLSSALGVPVEEIQQACHQGEKIQVEQMRHSFWKRVGPHIYIETKGPVSSATLAAICHAALKVIPLVSGNVPLPGRDYKSQIQDLIRTHYQEYGGLLPVYGKILGYIYRPTPDQEIAFKINGDIDLSRRGPARIDHGSIRVNGRDASFFKYGIQPLV